jgi:hypothetical protein
MLYLEEKYPHKQLKNKKKGCIEVDMPCDDVIYYLIVNGDLENSYSFDEVDYCLDCVIFPIRKLESLKTKEFTDGVSFYAIKNNEILWDFRLNQNELSLISQESNWNYTLREYMKLYRPPLNEPGAVVDIDGKNIEEGDELEIFEELNFDGIIIPKGCIFTCPELHEDNLNFVHPRLSLIISGEDIRLSVDIRSKHVRIKSKRCK